MKFLPRGSLKYLRAHWQRLIRFFDERRLWIDNNPTERAIRGPVVGRKNFYGARSKRGTEVAAMLYTIFQTAKACVVDPRDYLRQVVLADIRNPGTVTMPEPIQKLLEELAD